MEAAYDDIGRLYRRHRRPDPRLAARITAALGDARRVVNVGAGSGSYEPPTTVVAVEPSAVMAAQRPPGGAPVVRGVAERLPFPGGAFDAALAVLTAHHWSDKDAGLAELRRVSRRQVVFCTDLDVSHAFWLVVDYFPEIVAIEEARAAPPELIAERLAGRPHRGPAGAPGLHGRLPERLLGPARGLSRPRGPGVHVDARRAAARGAGAGARPAA